jgi:hypothetical protein
MLSTSGDDVVTLEVEDILESLRMRVASPPQESARSRCAPPVMCLGQISVTAAGGPGRPAVEGLSLEQANARLREEMAHRGVPTASAGTGRDSPDCGDSGK